MIVPVAFGIQREDAPESFVLEYEQLLPRATYEQMRVTFVLYDTELGRSRGISAQVMFDQGERAGHELATQVDAAAVWGSSEDYLRALRAGVDELLGEERSRWARFSDEELRELVQAICAAEESYDVSPAGELLGDQVEAELVARARSQS